MRSMTCAAAALILLGAPVAALTAAPRSATAAAPPDAAAPAAGPTAEEAAEIRRLKAILDGFKPQKGDVQLPEAKATLKLGDQYYFLGAEDSKQLLTELWGNPPAASEGVLGMVFPIGMSPVDENSWGAVLTWQADGYVSDHDAKEIKPDQLLKSLREGEKEENAARKEAGYPAVHVAGWAQPPSYDPASHTLVWARDIAFEGQADHSLNYDVRVLGRGGVLSVNMVAGMKDLAAVREAARAVPAVVAFNPGERYADYKEGDPKAAYGVAGLVAGGLGLAAAKKVGLLGILLLVLKKAWVFILAGLGGAGAWLKRLFSGRRAG